jgi:hypothetical protein
MICHFVPLPLPRLGANTPEEVRSSVTAASAPAVARVAHLLGHGMACNVIYCILNGQDLVRIRIRNLHCKLLFKSHHQLYHVEAVEAQILLKVCGRHDLVKQQQWRMH